MSDFSNYDRDIFVIKLDRMIDRGALMSRYSRTANLDIRDVHSKEFASDESRGRNFYKKVFLEYGDESIAELVTAQVGIQNVTNIASKAIEEVRVGLSFLEKSSRYVRYDKKIIGRYLFALPEKLGIKGNLAKDYEDHCSSLFDFYAVAYKKLLDEVKEKYNIEDHYFFSSVTKKMERFTDLEEQSDIDIAEKSYESAVRSRVLDEIRLLLPASTLTNLGISGNGRAFISLIQKLIAYDTVETREIAESLFSELKKEFPELMDSAMSNHGIELINYRKNMSEITNSPEIPVQDLPMVRLIDYENRENAINKVLSLLLYENGGDYNAISNEIEKIGIAEKGERLQKISSLRNNRRHKLGRAFESVNYLFEITTNYGAFRDLQRHRFMSIQRKPLSVFYGYDIPETLGGVPELKTEYTRLMGETVNVYKKFREKYDKKMAQYVVPYAYRYPVTASFNFNELTYFVELRSTPQAHEDLRQISMEIFRAVENVHPELAKVIKFVDTNRYPLGRLSSEARKERKAADLEKT